ncbi:MAG: response regulator [Acaryochloris sp. RU_4_1]|nr:response regulator [Acaryochloris sp. RU_4_1]NJR54138.1 response regulator [Acaryochloris sp. CRU_2_0]
MAHETPLRDPAYQLFFQEALELLSQIDLTLQEVLAVPSAAAIDFLLDNTQTLAQGAQSLSLTLLCQPAKTFEGLVLRFQQSPLALTPDDADALRQAYKNLQGALVTYLSQSEQPSGFISPVESSQSLAIAPPSPIAPAETSAVETDVTTLMLTTDVAELLSQLHQALVNPQVYNLADELKTHTEALLGWGEVLELSEFITIAQSTLEMLNSNPQSAVSIGQLALAGFQSAYKTALQSTSMPEASSPSLDKDQPRTSAHPITVAEIPTAEALSLSNEVTLNTALLLVWQQRNLLFTIPSEAVAEILIPRAEQVMGNQHQRCIKWQQQFMPLYRLVDLLNQGESHWPRLTPMATAHTPEPSPVFGKSPLLVVQQGGQTLGLEVEIARLVTEPELILRFSKSDQPPCPYYCGETSIPEVQQCGVIDLTALLHEILGVSPMPLLSAVPSTSISVSVSTKPSVPPKPIQKPRSQMTILVVDDSPTVRIMLNMVLESAGYQVLEAANGQLALDQLAEHTEINLVLCDVEMPKMNGFEFLEYRCRQPALADIPVVMLSTCNSDQHRRLANALGANAYLTKPYEETSLLATLQALIH